MPKSDKHDATRKSRLASRLAADESFAPPLPQHAPEFGYLMAALFEAGPVSFAGMGHTALTWADLAAWAHGTGNMPMPWEARLLRRLSADYISELGLAENPAYMSPYLPEDYVPDYGGTADSLRAALQGLSKT